MKDKESIDILKSLLEKYPLNKKEKEAIRDAIGMLSWSTLMEGRINRMKKARDKRISTED